MFRQDVLLRMALAERGIDAEVSCTKLDHWSGRAFVDGRRVGLVYPDSFFDAALPLMATPRGVRMFFIGTVDATRRNMLEPFRLHPDAVVIESNRGRSEHKNRWDPSYYHAMSEAMFGLCPHHTDWPGPWEHLWTYRFIDCVLVGTIPVVFRATPLADWLVDGFRWVWEDRIPHEYSREDAAHNRALAEERFRL